MSKAMTVKKFIAFSCEAIEGLSKNDARQTYKSIKTYKNKSWLKFQDAEDALSLKVELNEDIEELEDEIDENPDNKHKLTQKLNQLLSKPSTLSLIRALEIGFNKKHGTFAEITKKSKIIPNANNNLRNNKKKRLIASTTNDTEDSDDDEDVFSFEAYMKLREKNLGDDEKKNKNTPDFSKNKNILQNNIIYENTADTTNKSLYPVDQNANYNVIAAHFKFDTTKNKNIDHSELDFDDLQSLQLDEASSASDDEFADSQSVSTTFKKAESAESEQSSHRWSADEKSEAKTDVSEDSSTKKKSEKSAMKTDVLVNNENVGKSGKSEIKTLELNAEKSEKSEIKKKKKKKPFSPKRKMKKPPKNKKTSKKKKKNVNVENEEEISGELKLVSSMETIWNNLSDRALNDNNWNGEDCEKLIDEACVLNKKEILIHSLWLVKCKEYCNKHKNKTKQLQFGVIISYPSGQQCVSAKLSEIKYCLKHKIDRIVLYVCCGKIIDRDWRYIKKEVTNVNKMIGKKCVLQVKHAKSGKISAQTSAIFQQTVSQIIGK